MAIANPVQVQRVLAGLHYPATKDEIVEYAQDEGADEEILHTLDELPDIEFDSPAELSDTIQDIEQL